MAITNLTELANYALNCINAGSINSITGTDRAASLCNAKIDLAMKQVISEGEFTCTKRRSPLTLRVDLSRPDYQYCYYVPDDYVKGIELESGYPYEMETGGLFTNDDTPVLSYFSNLQNFPLYGPFILETMGYVLATMICMELKGDSNTLAIAESELAKMFRRAKAHDRSEKNGQKKAPSNWNSFNEGDLF